MSICTIDPTTYATLLNSTITRYRKAGLPLIEAKQRATELMRNAFHTFDDETQADLQKDTTDERSSDWTR